MNGIAGIILLTICWHFLWLARFKDALPDTDYGHFAYYGYFATRQHDWHILTGLPVWIGFKPGVYYLMAIAFSMFRSWNSPRFLFVTWNSLAAVTIYATLPQAGMMGVLLYLILSTAPYLGACYLQGEFWALLPTSALIGLSMGADFPGSGVVFGLLLLVNPLAFKITYLFESLALALFYQGSRLEMGIGLILFIVLLISGLLRTKIPAGTLHSIRTFNILTYFLHYGRKTKINLKALLTFKRELAAQLISLSLLFVYADRFLWFLIAAALLGAILQFRFYRYHLVPLIPVMAVLAARADGPLLWLALATPAIFAIPYWATFSPERLDALINRVITHYHKRNVVSRRLATWLRNNSDETEKILVVGDTPQLHIMANRISSNYYLDFDPNAAEAAPELADRLIHEILEHPPMYIVMMIDCLNWDYFGPRTGLGYEIVHVEHQGDEVFPIYRCVTKVEPVRHKTGRLFDGCKFISPDGRKIWNKILSSAPNLTNLATQ